MGGRGHHLCSLNETHVRPSASPVPFQPSRVSPSGRCGAQQELRYSRALGRAGLSKQTKEEIFERDGLVIQCAQRCGGGVTC